MCSALSTFRLTPPDGNRVALVKYCNFASGLTGELPEAAAALTTLVTGSTSSLDFLTSKQKCRVPLHGSEIDKGKTIQESSLKWIMKQFMKLISRIFLLYIIMNLPKIFFLHQRWELDFSFSKKSWNTRPWSGKSVFDFDFQNVRGKSHEGELLKFRTF